MFQYYSDSSTSNNFCNKRKAESVIDTTEHKASKYYDVKPFFCTCCGPYHYNNFYCGPASSCNASTEPLSGGHFPSAFFNNKNRPSIKLLKASSTPIFLQKSIFDIHIQLDDLIIGSEYIIGVKVTDSSNMELVDAAKVVQRARKQQQVEMIGSGVKLKAKTASQNLQLGLQFTKKGQRHRLNCWQYRY